jgi:hypothetical protein
MLLQQLQELVMLCDQRCGWKFGWIRGSIAKGAAGVWFLASVPRPTLDDYECLGGLRSGCRRKMAISNV